MRSLPASKFMRDWRRDRNLRAAPREGTRLREVYDLFINSKGQVIQLPVSMMTGHGRILADLSDYYGLDVRNLGYRKWVLAGEWFGRVYVDYIAEHLASIEKRGAA